MNPEVRSVTPPRCRGKAVSDWVGVKMRLISGEPDLAARILDSQTWHLAFQALAISTPPSFGEDISASFPQHDIAAMIPRYR